MIITSEVAHSYTQSLLLSQFPVRWFPCCIRSVAVWHTTVHKLVRFLVQLASIGQNVPGEQLLCANTPRDNDSSETTYNKTHINVLIAIAETTRGTLAPKAPSTSRHVSFQTSASSYKGLRYD